MYLLCYVFIPEEQNCSGIFIFVIFITNLLCMHTYTYVLTDLCMCVYIHAYNGKVTKEYYDNQYDSEDNLPTPLS